MEIRRTTDGNTVTLELDGKLSAIAAPDLQRELDAALEEFENILLDMSKVEYISSAGIRAILSTQKKILKKGNGKLSLIGLTQESREILEVTGMNTVLKIDE